MAMMLHRHFDKQKEDRDKLTTLNDVTPALPNDDEPFETAREDYQPRRGRKRKEE